jgi:hypothetical protein
MNDTPTPAYPLVQLKVKNHQGCMRRYGNFVVAMFEKIGAQVVAVSPAPKVAVFAEGFDSAALSRRSVAANLRAVLEYRDRNMQAYFIVPMEL